MEELDSIGIIGLGKAGRGIAFSIAEIADEIGCRELYLNSRSPDKANALKAQLEIDIVDLKKEKYSKQGKTFEFEVKESPAGERGIEDIVKNTDLAIICVGQDFGDGLEAVKRGLEAVKHGDYSDYDFLGQERKKLARLYGGDGETWPEQVRESFKDARKIYNALYNELPEIYKSLFKKDHDEICGECNKYGVDPKHGFVKNEFRILYSMPYNLSIVKKLAKQFEGYKGKVCIFTSPIDIMTYVFSLYSGVADVFGCNHYETFRELSCFNQGLKRKLEKDYGIELVGVPVFEGEHGPHPQAITFHIKPSKVYSIKKMQEALSSIGPLDEVIREEVRAYVGKIIRSGLDITEDTRHIIKEVIRHMINGEESGLSMVIKLKQFSDEKTLDLICGDKGKRKGLWNNYEMADKGMAIGLMRVLDGEFKIVNYERDLKEIKGIIKSYKKLHSVLKVIRELGFVEGEPEIREPEWIEPRNLIIGPEQIEILDYTADREEAEQFAKELVEKSKQTSEDIDRQEAEQFAKELVEKSKQTSEDIDRQEAEQFARELIEKSKQVSEDIDRQEAEQFARELGKRSEIWRSEQECSEAKEIEQREVEEFAKKIRGEINDDEYEQIKKEVDEDSDKVI